MARDRDGDAVSGEALIAMLERLARLTRAAEHDKGLNPAQWEALRFLVRANRFSSTPTGLTRYLGATKGTISQTLKSLEKKGFIEKTRRPDERRSVALRVTMAGLSALNDNPWTRLRQRADALGGKTRRRMEKGLQALLDEAVARGHHAAFGNCATCRHLSQGQHCRHFVATITAGEQEQLCAAFVAAE